MILRFVLMHLPGKITYKEIDEMIATVDKNEDSKISYSEFRVQCAIILYNSNPLCYVQVMLGAVPLVIPDTPTPAPQPRTEAVTLHST